MGYAARSRGTFEERKKQSIERQEKEHQEWLKRIKAREANKTPKERDRSRATSALLSAVLINGIQCYDFKKAP